LPTAALLATHGYQVAGIDVKADAVNTINEGKIHIVEPDLDAFVRGAVASGGLKAFTEPQPADVYIICVPTPFHRGEGIPQPNIDYVLAATRSIAPLLKKDDLVILESTSPVGTTELVADTLASERHCKEHVQVAYCPERVLPGKILKELVENDRIVGGLTPNATKMVAEFYRTFVRGEVLETNARTAEMCKLTENSFRDVNIAFANELSMICANENIDVWELIKLANRHPRVNILQPGAGVGGHCIAVDPWFIVARAPEQARIIRTAREVNNHKTEWALDQIRQRVAEIKHEGPRIACLGLAFKPDIDDLRESPAVFITQALITEGFDVVAVEPNVPDPGFCKSGTLEEAVAEADLVVVLVRHKQFVAARERIRESRPVDLCGLLS